MVGGPILPHLHVFQINHAARSIQQERIRIPLRNGRGEKAIRRRLHEHRAVNLIRAYAASVLCVLNTASNLTAYGADTMASDAGCVLAPHVPVPVEPFTPRIDEPKIIGVLMAGE